MVGAMLAAAQGGDGDAYRAFLKAILPFARAVARRRAPSVDAAEDIVQDALLTSTASATPICRGAPVRPWLAAIVSRRAIDAARRHGRIGVRETHNPVAYETFADEAAKRSEDAAISADEVGRMMDGLTPRQKEAWNW
jgi:RNA polymerase sigma-70 factor (ECF subfamily)